MVGRAAAMSRSARGNGGWRVWCFWRVGQQAGALQWIGGGRSCEFVVFPGAARRRLIDDRPKQTQFLYRGDKLLEVHRFDDISTDAQLIASYQILFLARGGEHHDRDLLQ